MSAIPEVSVVMSVYNGEERLAETIDSMLAQVGVDFELVLVDDGSTDATGRIADEYAARDSRIRVIHQANTGLTGALITGCRTARAPLIARQDCGDRSRPERLRKQRDLLAREADVVLVTCHSQHIAPEGEPLYVDKALPGDQIRKSLLTDGIHSIRGLVHGSAMFRRNAYFEAGEYRPQFRFAQDLDLWIRLARLGRIATVEEVLFEARFEPRAISAVNRAEQVALARISIALRDSGAGEQQMLLDRAALVGQSRPVTSRDEAKGLYFVASCLRAAHDPRWRGYAWRAVRRNPLHLRAWGRLLTSR
jgi:glycosyltransferase involved in cell wall biosynthesis